jgi:hypothetical protein
MPDGSSCQLSVPLLVLTESDHRYINGTGLYAKDTWSRGRGPYHTQRVSSGLIHFIKSNSNNLSAQCTDTPLVP